MKLWSRLRLWSAKPQVGHATPEASAALHHANRLVVDAQNVRKQAGERVVKAEEVAAKLEETKRQNHFGPAVAETMRRIRKA